MISVSIQYYYQTGNCTATVGRLGLVSAVHRLPKTTVLEGAPNQTLTRLRRRSGLSALPTFIFRKCCAMDEWPVLVSCTAAIGQGPNGGFGPQAATFWIGACSMQPCRRRSHSIPNGLKVAWELFAPSPEIKYFIRRPFCKTGGSARRRAPVFRPTGMPVVQAGARRGRGGRPKGSGFA